jgi:hypothetical protein
MKQIKTFKTTKMKTLIHQIETNTLPMWEGLLFAAVCVAVILVICYYLPEPKKVKR